MPTLEQPEVRRRIIGVFVGLVLANLGVWAWALAALRDHPLLLGTAAAAYGFGLRHAVDADHIAAIDNVTRRLMQEGQRPVGVGLFFALGHSSVVVLACVAVALTTSALTTQLRGLREIGATIGTLVSFGFLWLIAAFNLLSLRRTFVTLRSLRRGEITESSTLEGVLAQQGLVARWLRPLFNLMRRSPQMFLLGFLFGLGFETATEVLLLGMSAEQAAHGMSIFSILLFPALFTAGMTLIDTTDGVLMMGAYGWAFIDPIRKLHYNIVITLLSAAIALLVGGVEVLGLLNDHFGFTGYMRDTVGLLSGHLGGLGYIVIGLFVLCWLGSIGMHRLRGDRDARNQNPPLRS